MLFLPNRGCYSLSSLLRKLCDWATYLQRQVVLEMVVSCQVTFPDLSQLTPPPRRQSESSLSFCSILLLIPLNWSLYRENKGVNRLLQCQCRWGVGICLISEPLFSYFRWLQKKMENSILICCCYAQVFRRINHHVL